MVRQPEQPQHAARLRERREGLHALHRHCAAGGVSHRHARPSIAWRDTLTQRGLGGRTIRHRLASLASLFEDLCERNAVTHNPVKGVERPRTESGEGKTPAIGDHQARDLLAAPQADTIKSKRDRAILSTLLFHALRREELCKLKVRDARHARKGVPHLKVSGKGGKTRYLPLHPGTNALIHDYLAVAGHGEDEAGALFRPVRNNRTGKVAGAITADGVYKLVRGYSAALGFEIGAHALRATAATNALDHQADIANLQERLGHANIATTRMYAPGPRTVQPSKSPTEVEACMETLDLCFGLSALAVCACKPVQLTPSYFKLGNAIAELGFTLAIQTI